MAGRVSLRRAVAALEKLYGAPAPPLADPFALVIWESCAYLVDDTRRRAVFEGLVRRTRLAPEAILGLPPAALAALIAPGGMHPERRAEKLHTCAEIALEVGLDHLREVVRTDPRAARKLLKRFPGIGDPGADKILLFAGGQGSLAPESNGLRVLLRLGFGGEEGDYARSYRSTAAAVAAELPTDASWLARAHLLLQEHGRTLCKRTAPRCEACPLTRTCVWYRGR